MKSKNKRMVIGMLAALIATVVSVAIIAAGVGNVNRSHVIPQENIMDESKSIPFEEVEERVMAQRMEDIETLLAHIDFSSEDEREELRNMLIDGIVEQ
jgi:hypothetical protein